MKVKTEIILITPPQLSHAAMRAGPNLAHLSYKLESGLRLMRGSLNVPTAGSFMALTDEGYQEAGGDAERLARQISSECLRQGFAGVLMDFASGPSEGIVDLIRLVGPELRRNRLPLYLSADYARFCPDARVLISSGLTGGSFRTRLEEAVAEYGEGRPALAVFRLCHDMTLGSPDKSMKTLSQHELRVFMEKHSPMVFYSSELCVNYFTCRDESGEAHFVLFDDARTIQKKISLAASFNISPAFLLYPEVKDILEQIIAQTP